MGRKKEINMQNIQESGRSMIEMLGVLSIIGILTVGGYGLISKMQENNRINEVIDNVTSLAYKVRPLARDYQAGDIEGCTSQKCLTKYAYDGRAYPEGLEYSNYAFTDRNNVKYAVYKVQNNTRKGLFVISISKFSEKMCLQLATTNFGSRSSTGYVGMHIGTSVGGDTFTHARGQRTIAEAISECNGTNTMINLVFK